MASLKKRGKYYYGQWQKRINGNRTSIVRILGVTYEDLAKAKLEKLERLEQEGKIDPYQKGFEPKKILRNIECIRLNSTDTPKSDMLKQINIMKRQLEYLEEIAMSLPEDKSPTK